MSGFTYVINANGILVSTQYDGTGSTELSDLPNTVINITPSAFYNTQDYITKLIVPNSVTSITLSLRDWPHITSVIFTDGAQIINTTTNLGNNPYTGQYTIGWLSNAFKNATSLTTLVIPTTSILSIGSQFASNCVSLSAFTIPNTVEFLGSYAFGNCTSLTSIAIPKSMKYISLQCFVGCSSLATIDFSAFILGDVLPILATDCFKNTGISTTNYSSVTNMVNIGYTKNDLIGAGFPFDVVNLAINTLANYYDSYYSQAAIANNVVIPSNVSLASLFITFTDFTVYFAAGFSYSQIMSIYPLQAVYNDYYSPAAKNMNVNIPSELSYVNLFAADATISETIAADFLNLGFPLYEMINAGVFTSPIITGDTLTSLSSDADIYAAIGSSSVPQIIKHIYTATPNIPLSEFLTQIQTVGIPSIEYLPEIIKYYDSDHILGIDGITEYDLFVSGATSAYLINSTFNTNLKVINELRLHQNPTVLVTDLKTAGYSATDLKDALFTLDELKAALFSATELYNAGYSLSDLQIANYSVDQVVTGLAAAATPVTVTGANLKEAGYSATELYNAGYSLSDLQIAGYSVDQVVKGLAAAASPVTVSITQLEQANFLDSDITASGDFTLNAADFAVIYLQVPETPVSIDTMYTLGFTVLSVYKLNNVAVNLIVDSARFTIAEILAANCYTLTDIQLAYYQILGPTIPNLVSVANLFTVKIDIADYFAANFDYSQIISIFSLQTVYNDYYSATPSIGGAIPIELSYTNLFLVELNSSNVLDVQSYFDANFSFAQVILILMAGYNIDDQDPAHITYSQIITFLYNRSIPSGSGTEPVTVSMLYNAVTDIQSGHDLQAIVDYANAGVDPSFTVDQLFRGGFTNLQIYYEEYNSNYNNNFSVYKIIESDDFTLADILLSNYSLSLQNIYDQYYKVPNTIIPSCVSVVNLLVSFTDLTEYKTAGFTVAQLYPPFTVVQLHDAGFNVSDTVTGLRNLSPQVLVSIQDLIDAGFDVVNIVNSTKFPETTQNIQAFLAVTPSGSAATLQMLLDNQYVTLEQIVNSAYENGDLMITDLTALTVPFTIDAMFNAGLITLSDYFRSAFETNKDMIAALLAITSSNKVTVSDLWTAGFTNLADYNNSGTVSNKDMIDVLLQILPLGTNTVALLWAAGFQTLLDYHSNSLINTNADKIDALLAITPNTVTISDLWAAGFQTLSDYNNSGTVSNKNMIVNLLQILPLRTNTVALLWAAGFQTLSDYYAASYLTKHLMIDALLQLGTNTVSLLWTAGFQTLSDYINSNHETNKVRIDALLAITPNSVSLLWTAGFQTLSDYNSNSLINTNADKIDDLLQLGTNTVALLWTAGFQTLSDYYAASYLTKPVMIDTLLQILPNSVALLWAAGFQTLSEYYAAGYLAKSVMIKKLMDVLMASPISNTKADAIIRLFGVGFQTIADYIAAGYLLSDLTGALDAVKVFKQVVTTLQADLINPDPVAIQQLMDVINTNTYTTATIVNLVSLPTIYASLYTTRLSTGVPDLVSVAAIVAANPTLTAATFQAAGFTPIQVYSSFTNAELFAGGYTTIPVMASVSYRNA